MLGTPVGSTGGDMGINPATSGGFALHAAQEDPIPYIVSFRFCVRR